MWNLADIGDTISPRVARRAKRAASRVSKSSAISKPNSTGERDNRLIVFSHSIWCHTLQFFWGYKRRNGRLHPMILQASLRLIEPRTLKRLNSSPHLQLCFKLRVPRMSIDDPPGILKVRGTQKKGAEEQTPVLKELQQETRRWQQQCRPEEHAVELPRQHARLLSPAPLEYLHVTNQVDPNALIFIDTVNRHYRGPIERSQQAFPKDAGICYKDKIIFEWVNLSRQKRR